MNRIPVSAPLKLACLLFLCASAWAQIPSARLEGIILDPAGNPVTGAKIAAVHDTTGWKTQVESNDEGRFVFGALAPGVYTISAAADGYKPADRTNVSLSASGSFAERFTLVPGAAKAPEKEEGAKERQNDSNSELAGAITRRDLEILQMFNRVLLDLAVFQPGIQHEGGNPGYSLVNGTAQWSNNITLDGMDSNDAVDPRLGLSETAINPDSVDQFVVITAGGKAEYGRNAGGQVLITSRSGTRRWHGNAFDYVQDDFLNANDFFNNAANVRRPVIMQNIFGGSAGGPVIKGRTFIFGNYQGRRTSEQIVRNRTVLTPVAKAGVFRWYQPGTSNTNAFDIVRNDPRKLGIDPKVSALLAKLPDPNNTLIGDGLNTGGFVFRNPNDSSEDQVTIRADHSLKDNHRLFLRFSGQRGNAVDSANGADATYPGQPQGYQKQRRWGVVLGSDWNLSPTMVNQVRAGYQRGKISLDRPARLAGPMLLANSWTDPLDPSFGRWRNSPLMGFTDNLTFIRGKHVFKAGGSFNHTWQKGYNQEGAYPNVTFARAYGNIPPSSIGPSGAAITPTDRQKFENLYNDLVGRMDQVTQTYYSDLNAYLSSGTARDRTFAFREYGFFLQDDWKLRPNLTLNFGVRYELSSVPTESSSIQGALDKADAVSPTANISNFTVLRDGNWYKRDAANFAPRVGFAWRPFGNTKTVLRGGYGLFFDRLPGKTANLVDYNTPATSQDVSRYPNLQGNDVRVSDGIPLPPQPSPPALQLPNARSTTISIFTPDLRTPRVEHFYLSMQREVLRNLILEAGYVGERARKLLMYRNYNELKVAGDFLQSFRELQRFRTTGTPVPPSNTLVKIFGSVNAAITAIGGTVLDQGLAGDAAQNVDKNYYRRYSAAGVSDFYLRNYTQYDQFAIGTNDGRSSYDSFQANLRMNKGPYKVYANYTWSKSFDNLSTDCSGCVSPIDSMNPSANRALSNGYRSSVFNGWFQYAIPLGKGRYYCSDASGFWNAIIGGWDLSVMGVYENGTPFSITSGRRTARGDIASYPDYSGTLPQGSIQRGSNGVYYFTADQIKQFSYPVAGSIGSTGRNVFLGPDYQNLAASLLKSFNLPGERRLLVRLEAYNVFNRTNFGQLGTNLSDPATFGRFTATQGSARRIQVALRYEF